MSANGFVATTSSATTPSARSAAAWPASSSSGRTGRRGRSRSRATIQPSPASDGEPERARRAASARRRATGGRGGAAAARRRASAKSAEEPRRTRARSRGGCGSCEARARCGSGAGGSARRGRRSPRGTAAALRRARARSPSRGRSGCRGRRSSTARARARRPAACASIAFCVARPICPRRAARSAGRRRRERRRAGRSAAVVIVTAGMPRVDERRLLVAAVREAEVDELPERARRARGSAPVSAASRARTVSTSPGVGERGRVAGELEPRPARGPAIASRLTTAITFRRSGACAANQAAPSPPSTAPSVERKTSVYGSAHAGARRRQARRRARARAAPPSRRRCRSRPGPTPVSSRCAMTTIVFCERPAFATSRLTKRTRPRPGTSAVNGSLPDREAVGRELSTRTSVPRRPRPAVPGTPARPARREVGGERGGGVLVERGREVRGRLERARAARR